MCIKINLENQKKLDTMIEYFINNLINPKNLVKYTNEENLLYISELLGTNYENEQLVENANQIIEEIVHKIETGDYFSGGMFSSLGMFAFSIDNINKKTGDLSKLSLNLNKILLNYGNFLSLNYTPNSLRTDMYDCISGVSGILYFLLNTNYNLLDFDKIQNMIEYIINLTNYHEYKDKMVLNFHIENKNIDREDEKQIYPDGIINFGMAHGMAGVLAALVKTHQKGVYRDKEKIIKAIKTLLNIYEKYVYYFNNIPVYPTQLKYSDFINKNSSNLTTMCSWCYGNISNEYILLKAYDSLGETDNYKKHETNLINIINQDESKYSFTVPVLCHGHASVISEQISLYRYTNKKKFISNLDRNMSSMISVYNYINNKYLNINVDDLNPMLGTDVIQGHKYDFNMLNGSGGIFLTLLNIVSEKTSYSKLLMID